MQEITIEERNDWFCDTINLCSSKSLKKSDDELVGIVYDDLAGDLEVILYSDSLKPLLENNFIDQEIYILSIQLREKYMKLEKEGDGTIKGLRHNEEWLNVFRLGDRISELKSQFDRKMARK